MHKQKSINLKKLFKKNNILFFGDDHDMNQGRYWLSKELLNLDNIDYLGIEYIDTSKQELINNSEYNKLGIYLKKVYKDFPGFSPDSIINLIKIAKTKNIKVYGIEMPEASFDNWYTKEAQDARVKYISKQIIKISKLGKGIILLGADHVEKNRKNVCHNIKKRYEDILSIIFIGGRNWSQDTEEYWIRKLEMDSQRNKIQNDFFVIRTKNHIFPTDYILHFPQIEKIGVSLTYS